nr:LysR family transcriptional regulator [Bradyrhizobium sp. 199]
MLDLEALLRERNVTRAASRLNIGQPALSARLNRLRQVLLIPCSCPPPRTAASCQRRERWSCRRSWRTCSASSVAWSRGRPYLTRSRVSAPSLPSMRIQR